MKIESLDNLEPREIAEEEKTLEKEAVQDIEKMAIEGVEMEEKELDIIEKKGGIKMSTLKKAMVGISIGLALMTATEVIAQEQKGYQWQEQKILTPAKPYKTEDLFKAIEEMKKEAPAAPEQKTEQQKMSPEMEAKKQEILAAAMNDLKATLERLEKQEEEDIKKGVPYNLKRQITKQRINQLKIILGSPDAISKEFYLKDNAVIFKYRSPDGNFYFEYPYQLRK